MSLMMTLQNCNYLYGDGSKQNSKSTYYRYSWFCLLLLCRYSNLYFLKSPKINLKLTTGRYPDTELFVYYKYCFYYYSKTVKLFKNLSVDLESKQ